MSTAESIACAHHERWDGRGYPNGIAGDDIPAAARIVAIADVFDAVTTPRQYRGAWPVDKALAAIREGAGTQFDPQYAGAFLDLADPRKPEDHDHGSPCGRP
jgi:HD-GYP domain-containing protein (c-di-GMP phosphodiesterase class II)